MVVVVCGVCVCVCVCVCADVAIVKPSRLSPYIWKMVTSMQISLYYYDDYYYYNNYQAIHFWNLLIYFTYKSMQKISFFLCSFSLR